MIVSDINFSNESIIINEEKMGLLGIKNKTLTINFNSINAIVKRILDNEILEILIKYKNGNLYILEKEKCVPELNNIYENIIKNRVNKLFEVMEVDLSTDDIEVNILMEKDK